MATVALATASVGSQMRRFLEMLWRRRWQIIALGWLAAALLWIENRSLRAQLRVANAASATEARDAAMRAVTGMRWGTVRQVGHRAEWRARLWDIPRGYGWKRACERTPLEGYSVIGGRPDWCEVTVMVGRGLETCLMSMKSLTVLVFRVYGATGWLARSDAIFSYPPYINECPLEMIVMSMFVSTSSCNRRGRGNLDGSNGTRVILKLFLPPLPTSDAPTHVPCTFFPRAIEATCLLERAPSKPPVVVLYISPTLAVACATYGE
jgi:hypothetical protein